jgi:hypothetical protein
MVIVMCEVCDRMTAALHAAVRAGGCGRGDWQLRLFDTIRAECEANDRLRAEDPAALRAEAKMRAQLPTCSPRATRPTPSAASCGERPSLSKGYGHNAHPVCATTAWRATRATGRSRIVVPQRFRKWAP